jgi:hypothetical protein
MIARQYQESIYNRLAGMSTEGLGNLIALIENAEEDAKGYIGLVDGEEIGNVLEDIINLADVFKNANEDYDMKTGEPYVI